MQSAFNGVVITDLTNIYNFNSLPVHLTTGETYQWYDPVFKEWSITEPLDGGLLYNINTGALITDTINWTNSNLQWYDTKTLSWSITEPSNGGYYIDRTTGIIWADTTSNDKKILWIIGGLALAGFILLNKKGGK